jgi:ABC-type amino acid transport substrate-binding protein
MFKILTIYMLLLINGTNLFAKEPSKVKIGTLIYNPPYEVALIKNHTFYGFNIELMDTLCQTIGIHCKFVPMRFDKLIKALDNNKIDAIIVGISLKPNQPSHYLFTYPYFIGNAAFLSLNSTKLKTLNDKKIGVVTNTIINKAMHYDLLINKKNHRTEKNTIKLTYYKNLPQLLSALNQGDVDAIILDSGAAFYWQQQSKGRYKVIGPIVSLPKGMMIMAQQNKKKLIELMNLGLKTMERNGRLLRIYKHYWATIHPKHKASGKLVPLGAKHYDFYIQSMPFQY